ncbi:MAG: hypothetical protein MH137_05965 [Flavobacteriales bacterium]|nr:hypothetical protein [Flavobacteriales bacterium]
MKTKLTLFAAAVVALSFTACKKNKEDGPRLVFKFQFDSTQARLNNVGQPSVIPAGNAAQTPMFNLLSGHYIELAPTAFTALGTGEVIYHAPEVNVSGGMFNTAIDHNKCTPVGNGQTFFSIPISEVNAGTYEWLRVSLAYQNYDIKYAFDNPLNPGQTLTATGTVASFIGYNTYIENYTIKNQSIAVNGPKLQGYWGFETTVFNTPFTTTGQAPPGAITVPNPLFNSSPIPAGSCVVTAAFTQPLVITGNETQDKVVTVSISINRSFEWKEEVEDGLYQPDAGEVPVDMGVRGMIPSWQ